MITEELQQQVKEQMPEKRWIHTLGVIECSIALAERYGANPSSAELAALLHDYCKSWPIEKQRQVLVEHQMTGDLLHYNKSMWHAPAAAAVARYDLGIEDEEVLGAIRYHTSGRENMSLLEKVVCLADYIEPGRHFPGVDKIREKAQESLEAALLMGFDSTVTFLLEMQEKIYPLTILARNDLIDGIKKKKEADE